MDLPMGFLHPAASVSPAVTLHRNGRKARGIPLTFTPKRSRTCFQNSVFGISAAVPLLVRAGWTRGGTPGDAVRPPLSPHVKPRTFQAPRSKWGSCPHLGSLPGCHTHHPQGHPAVKGERFLFRLVSRPSHRHHPCTPRPHPCSGSGPSPITTPLLVKQRLWGAGIAATC